MKNYLYYISMIFVWLAGFAIILMLDIVWDFEWMTPRLNMFILLITMHTCGVIANKIDTKAIEEHKVLGYLDRFIHLRANQIAFSKPKVFKYSVWLILFTGISTIIPKETSIDLIVIVLTMIYSFYFAKIFNRHKFYRKTSKAN